MTTLQAVTLILALIIVGATVIGCFFVGSRSAEREDKRHCEIEHRKLALEEYKAQQTVELNRRKANTRSTTEVQDEEPVQTQQPKMEDLLNIADEILLEASK